MKGYAAIEPKEVSSNHNSRRNRILSAYSEFIDTFEEHSEEKNEAGNLLDYDPEEGYDRTEDRWYNTGFCGKITDTLWYYLAVDVTTLPFKLLYIFTRGGYSAITTYLVIYFTQIGISPTDVGRIHLVPHLLTALATAISGYLADALFGNIFLLLVAVVIWATLSLCITLVPRPEFADCFVALKQLATKIDRDEDESKYHEPCISDQLNLTNEEIHQWGSILRLPVTYWSSELESCYPGHHFTALSKQESSTSLKLPSYGVVFTASQQTEIASGWMYEEDSLLHAFTFGFILIATGTMMQQIILTLTDGETLRKLGRERRHEYGLQSSSGTAGFAVCSVALAYILHATGIYKYICSIPVIVQDYYPAVIFHMVTSVCSFAIVIALFFSKCQDNNEKASFNARDLIVIFRRGSFVPIVITAFFLSVCEGLVQPYLIWHIQYIGGTTSTIIWSIVSMSTAELIMAYATGSLILQFGYSPLLCVGVGVYFVRYLLYALLSNTAIIYIAEILHGISTALTWNVIVAYLSGAVPRECLSFLIGVLRGLCFGLGEGFGILIAGYFIDAQGTFNTYYMYSLFCLTGCFVLVIYQTSRAALPVSNGEAHHPPEGNDDDVIPADADQANENHD